MSVHYFRPVDGQRGPYNSAEHESLRATARSLIAVHGEAEGRRRAEGLLDAMGVKVFSHLSPEGAYWCRKFLERQLPECHV